MFKNIKNHYHFHMCDLETEDLIKVIVRKLKAMEEYYKQPKIGKYYLLSRVDLEKVNKAILIGTDLVDRNYLGDAKKYIGKHSFSLDVEVDFEKTDAKRNELANEFFILLKEIYDSFYTGKCHNGADVINP